MVKNKIFLFIILFFSALMVEGQDIHFSLFNYSPLSLNPAFQGNFDGEYRFAANHRQQWRAVTVPYITTGFSADMRGLVSHGFGAGISFFSDQAGDSRFSTNQINLGLGHAFKIDADSTQFIHAGFQIGFTQRGLSYSDLFFDNQFNGYYHDKATPVNETFPRDDRNYPTASLGLGYTKILGERKKISVGVSSFNLNMAKQSFFDNKDIRLDQRFTGHAEVQYPVAKKWDVIPSALYMRQGTFQEIIIGGSAKYIKNPSPSYYRAFYAGIWARTQDAGFVSLGMDYDTWKFGLSYDINLSNLVPASNYRGGFEVAVIYILKRYKQKEIKHVICPSFI